MRIYTKSVRVLGVTKQELEVLKEMIAESSVAKTLPAGHSVEKQFGRNTYLRLDVSDEYTPQEQRPRMPMHPNNR